MLRSRFLWMVLLFVTLVTKAGAESTTPPTLADLVARYRQELAQASTTRTSTLLAIAALDSKECVLALAELLDNAAPADQQSIVDAIARTTRPESARPLAKLADKENANASARTRAVSALGAIPGKDALAALVKLLESSNASMTSSAVAGLNARWKLALAAGDEKEAQTLARLISEQFRAGKFGVARAAALSAVEGQAKRDEESWMVLLRQRAASEDDPATLAGIFTALGKRADVADLPLMLKAARHEAEPVRAAAIGALSRYESAVDERRAVFIEAAADASDRIREAAFAGLKGSSDPRALELAARALAGDAALAVQRHAAEVLAAANTPQATTLLLSALALVIVAPPAEGAAASADQQRKLIDSMAGSLAATLDDDELESFIASAARSNDLGIRIASIAALGHAASPQADSALIEAIMDKDARVGVAAIRAVVRARTEGALPQLARAMRTRRVKEIVLESLIAMGELGAGNSDAAAAITEALDHTVIEVVMTAIEAAGKARVAPAIMRLARFLEDEAWQLRSAAVAALRAIRTKECIVPLIDGLAREEGKVQAEILLALAHVTGKEIGPDVELWRSWWSIAGADFEVPPIEEQAASGDRTVTAGTFYGIPVLSRRLVFVLDISGSMSASAGTGSRLAVAQEELSAVVLSLERDARFNLLFFDHVIESWQKRMSTATRAAKADAIRLVRRQAPRGGTNIFDAIERAFTDPEIDTIYLLTDGQPSAGRFTDLASIQKEVAAMNRMRRITIHCVSVGADSPLLKALAADSGGVYVRK